MRTILLAIIILLSSCSRNLTPQHRNNEKLKVQHIVFVGVTFFFVGLYIGKEIKKGK